MAKKSAKKPLTPLADPNIQELLSTQIGFDSLSLLNAIIDEWGGPKSLARDLRLDYEGAKVGSMTRQRIIEMISRLTIQVTNQGQANVKDASDLTDAELVEMARELMSVPNEEYDDPSMRPDA